MKQLIHDIRAAWPRERRFTWRGWVLLGVLGGLIVAAWRGCDPVYLVQAWLMDFGWDLLLYATVNLGILPWWETAFPAVSLLSVPGIFLAFGLRRPRAHYLWYVLVFTGAWFVPLLRFKAYVWLSDAVGWGASWAHIATFTASAVLWGACFSRVMRLWLPLLALPLLTALTLIASGFLNGRRISTPGFLMPDWAWVGHGFGFEHVAYQVFFCLGLAWIALHSWHVPPAHLCRGCGYDRRGLAVPAACPECGMRRLTVTEATSNPAPATP